MGVATEVLLQQKRWLPVAGPSPDWRKREAELWRKMMDPRTYRGLSESAALALSWKLYDLWVHH
jgi:hypothetical protein